MQENKTVTSELVTMLRYPLIVSVVVHHCFFWVSGWHYNQLSEQSIGSNVVSELILSSRILISSVVPIFFLISGYFFFVHLKDWDTKVWKRKMKRRVWTLLIPYILWNTFFFLHQISPEIPRIIHGNSWEIINSWVNNHGGWLGMYWNGRIISQETVDIWGLPTQTNVPILLPFYFIRNLMVVTLFTPLLHFLLRARNKSVTTCAAVTIGLLLFLHLSKTSFILSGFSAEAFFFFGLGAFLSLNGFELSEAFYAKRKVIAFVYLSLFFIELFFGFQSSNIGKILHPLYAVFEAMTVVNCASWLVKKSPANKRLSALKNALTRWQHTSFMIYALHFFLIVSVRSFFNKVIGATTGYNGISAMGLSTHYPYLVLIIFLTKIVIIVSICMIVSILLERFFPRFNKILCGR